MSIGKKYNNQLITPFNLLGNALNSGKQTKKRLIFFWTKKIIIKKISEFGAALEGSDLPTTTERSTETTVRVKDGETIVISGLRNTRTENSVSKLPLLGDIPVIGSLFKNSTKRESVDEFIVVITPRLIYDEPGKQMKSQITKFSAQTQDALVEEDERKKEKK